MRKLVLAGVVGLSIVLAFGVVDLALSQGMGSAPGNVGIGAAVDDRTETGSTYTGPGVPGLPGAPGNYGGTSAPNQPGGFENNSGQTAPPIGSYENTPGAFKAGSQMGGPGSAGQEE